MRDLLLVRHGASEPGAWIDLPLTNRGRRQAQETNQRLQVLLTELVWMDSMEFCQ
ncbi:MAG: hypothetical protein GWO20_02160 [Candidatus Korarchaeota archaeon]|nr:hypothetical protein [Candidatus Korarchaeota archaeon]NIU82294.1 hypothetical protein [Candidatus Thorarchaeota archaeon]NIW50988.1 hypothetical protein [Candidatus Korarchaeota archaeon]